MVKHIHVEFENEVFKKLKKAKGGLTWREFILEAGKQKSEGKKTGILNAFKEMVKKGS